MRNKRERDDGFCYHLNLPFKTQNLFKKLHTLQESSTLWINSIDIMLYFLTVFLLNINV